MQGIVCRTCNAGEMIRCKRYRMSGPVVVIGYILLIPSVIGILISGLLVFGSGTAAKGMADDAEAAERRELRAANLPEGIIDKAVAGTPLSPQERTSLTQEQQAKIDAAPVSISARKAGAGIGGVMAGGLSVCLGVSCFVSGLLWWALIMKKRVLQCHRCGAVVAAS